MIKKQNIEQGSNSIVDRLDQIIELLRPTAKRKYTISDKVINRNRSIAKKRITSKRLSSEFYLPIVNLSMGEATDITESVANTGLIFKNIQQRIYSWAWHKRQNLPGFVSHYRVNRENWRIVVTRTI